MGASISHPQTEEGGLRRQLMASRSDWLRRSLLRLGPWDLVWDGTLGLALGLALGPRLGIDTY